MASELRPKFLRDLGERRIVKTLIAPRFPVAADQFIGIGDDCAVLPAPPPGFALAVTIDPCPTPVVCLIEPPDLYHYGRMVALINLSDLAAMGARPLGLLISTVMPEEMPVADYERFLDGLAEASSEWSCPVIGGNIKDGPDFSATGSALGAVKTDATLRRVGARPGDQVCVIGEMGLFWAAVLARIESGIMLPDTLRGVLDEALYKPVARVKEGINLAESHLATSCMDSSDGVSGCLFEIAAVNEVDIVVSSTALQPHAAVCEVAKAANINALKLMLSWGNWELVCTIPRDSCDNARHLIQSLGTSFSNIGEVREGTGKVLIEVEGRYGTLSNLASERFSGTSLFTHGLDAYLNHLRTVPLAMFSD